MDEKLLNLLRALKTERQGIPQLAFFAKVYPPEVHELRKAVIHFKEKHPAVKEIDFIIYSPGGYADEAYKLIRTLRQNFQTVNVIVPLWAKSAATLVVLGGSKIVLDEFGECGPLDAQLAKQRDDSPGYERESALKDEYSVSIIESHFKQMVEQMFVQIHESPNINIPRTELSEQLLKNLSKFYKPLVAQIDTLKLGEKKRSLDVGSNYANRIMLQYGKPLSDQHRRLLTDYLINECPDHGYVIDAEVLLKFLGNVVTPEEFANGSEYRKKLQALSIGLVDAEMEAEGGVGDVIEFISDAIVPEPIPETPVQVQEGNIDAIVKEIVSDGANN